MKKLSIVSVLVMAVVAWSCSDVRRTPGHVYMPDMAYSVAFETYAPIDTLEKLGIHYNRTPVAGTIKRGELLPYPLAKDKVGDTANYAQSVHVTNPLPALDAVQLKEAERLYLVNCGICQMFYSVTYGKGQMGSYASQLSSTQRWQIIHYVKSKQGGGKQDVAAAPAADTTAAAGAAKAKPSADTTSKK